MGWQTFRDYFLFCLSGDHSHFLEVADIPGCAFSRDRELQAGGTRLLLTPHGSSWPGGGRGQGAVLPQVPSSLKDRGRESQWWDPSGGGKLHVLTKK